MKANNFEDEFTREDIEIARDVNATYDCGMSRIVLKAPEQRYKIYSSLFKTPRSKSATLDCRTLKLEYAIQVWTKAALISADNPSNLLYYWWLHWEDSDGPFRKLVYSNFYRDITVEQLLAWFWDLLEKIADSGEITVCEGFHIYSEGVGNTGPKCICQVVLDRDDARYMYKELSDVYTHTYSKQPVTYKWKDIKGFFYEMTLDQLRLTMPKELHRHSKMDDMLLQAAMNWDIKQIDMALERGAYINCLSEMGDSVLNEATDFFNFHGMSLDKEYTEEERQKIKEENTIKCKEVVQHLLDKGADINLFGYDSMPPLTCAYYARSIEMTKFLLERGANPNTNCYLEDCQYWPVLKNVRATILDVIDDLLSEDYTEIEKDIEYTIRQAGGRQYVWDFTPWNYENVGKYVLRLNPSPNDDKMFVDNSGWKIGDMHFVTIEDCHGNPTVIKLPEIKGLHQWNKDFQNNIANIHYDWISWKSRGLSMAKQIADYLPDSVAFYYLRDNDEVMQKELYDGRLYFSHNGDYIRIK